MLLTLLNDLLLPAMLALGLTFILRSTRLGYLGEPAWAEPKPRFTVQQQLAWVDLPTLIILLLLLLHPLHSRVEPTILVGMVFLLLCGQLDFLTSYLPGDALRLGTVLTLGALYLQGNWLDHLFSLLSFGAVGLIVLLLVPSYMRWRKLDQEVVGPALSTYDAIALLLFGALFSITLLPVAITVFSVGFIGLYLATFLATRSLGATTTAAFPFVPLLVVVAAVSLTLIP